ncbi:MAG: type II toxin-antitoxin system VapC family toxin [Lamprocystis purpurea]|uniref:type II toxin-antitoxin system VapC family toxin n=1 Tax=Lamprocystis purpurea TaxID=61598 RepID=UPI00036BD241|nr:type II toxin-antitoxin system VapC family toxin [Lamprocystis purpurea]MBV5274057.1 type II toxin-antitoxin system VapC family toxin [Lamprocystis purpurea]
MRVLLDTHSFLWLVTDDPKLSERAKSVFLDGDNELLCSAVVGFEIAVKFSLGKLDLAEPPREFMEKRIRHNALKPLAVTLEHSYRLAQLPFHHRDPFDRLLVAQALEEDLALLSIDAILSEYGVRRIW